MMVMTYLHGREAAVAQLNTEPKVHPPHATMMSFCVTPEMKELGASSTQVRFGQRRIHPCLVFGATPSRQEHVQPILVAINPNIHKWIEYLCSQARATDELGNGDARLFDNTLEYVRCHVLVPNRRQRHNAEALLDTLEDRLEKYKRHILDT